MAACYEVPKPTMTVSRSLTMAPNLSTLQSTMAATAIGNWTYMPQKLVYPLSPSTLATTATANNDTNTNQTGECGDEEEKPSFLPPPLLPTPKRLYGRPRTNTEGVGPNEPRTWTATAAASVCYEVPKTNQEQQRQLGLLDFDSPQTVHPNARSLRKASTALGARQQPHIHGHL